MQKHSTRTKPNGQLNTLYRITILGCGEKRKRAERILRGYGCEDEHAPGVWEVHLLPEQVERLRALVNVFAVQVPHPADWEGLQ